MKKSLKITLAVVVSTILLLTACCFIFISPPRFIFLMGLPEIAKDLPTNSIDADKEFNQRVQAKYGSRFGSLELSTSLKEEGFKVDTGGMAVIKRNKFPCTMTWTVTWINDIAAFATNIEGSFSESCL